MEQVKIVDKPENIDLEKLLGEQGAVTASDEKKLEEVDKEVAQQVQGTADFINDFPHSDREEMLLPSRSSTDRGNEIMSASFDPTLTVPEYIRGTFEQLSRIQQFFVGRDMQKIQRSQVLKVCKELFAYQYQDMQHVLMLGMDIQKKVRFAQYLNATKTLQIRIQNESAEAQRNVIATMFDNRVEAIKAKSKRDIEFDKLYRQGIIDKKQYEWAKDDNEKMLDEHISKLNGTMQMLIARHLEFLYKTLELFKTKLIEKGMI
jgi:hypothetical protein